MGPTEIWVAIIVTTGSVIVAIVGVLGARATWGKGASHPQPADPQDGNALQRPQAPPNNAPVAPQPHVPPDPSPAVVQESGSVRLTITDGGQFDGGDKVQAQAVVSELLTRP